MRYIKIVLDTEYCRTKNEIYMETDMNDRELDETCSELAYENAEDYDYMVLGWGEDIESYAEANDMSFEEVEEMMEQYYQDAQGASYWEEVTKEEYEENKEN
jgi:hypothetical protein